MITKIGVAWKKEKNGRSFYSGVIDKLEGQEKISIMIFPNNKRPGKKDPDVEIVLLTDDQPTGESERLNGILDAQEKDDL